MHEYETIEDFDVVSQGDVIEWVGDHRKSPWHTFGVVVTADCDLVLGKHRGFISYVPAWVSRDFVWFHWRTDALEAARDKAFELMATRLSTWRAKNGVGGTLSSEAVRGWLRRVGAEKLLEDLGVADLGQRNTLKQVIEPAEILDAVLRAEDPDMKLLAKAYACVKPSAAKDASILLKDMRHYWSQLPGDIFHLPSMPDGEDDDLFLLLRHIRQINSEELTARPEDVREGSAKAKRIARVTAPFRYAITQNLAKVFADIGLPDDYENRRLTSAQRFFDRWIEK